MTECQKFMMTMVRPASRRVFAFQRGAMLDMVSGACPRAAWSPTRKARVYYLIGQGLTSEEVASDPVVNCSSAYVRTLAKRAGLRMRPDRTLARDCATKYDVAALKRGLTREEMISLVVVCAAGCIDAVVDDEA